MGEKVNAEECAKSTETSDSIYQRPEAQQAGVQLRTKRSTGSPVLSRHRRAEDACQRRRSRFLSSVNVEIDGDTGEYVPTKQKGSAVTAIRERFRRVVIQPTMETPAAAESAAGSRCPVPLQEEEPPVVSDRHQAGDVQRRDNVVRSVDELVYRGKGPRSLRSRVSIGSERVIQGPKGLRGIELKSFLDFPSLRKAYSAMYNAGQGDVQSLVFLLGIKDDGSPVGVSTAFGTKSQPTTACQAYDLVETIIARQLDSSYFNKVPPRMYEIEILEVTGVEDRVVVAIYLDGDVPGKSDLLEVVTGDEKGAYHRVGNSTMRILACEAHRHVVSMMALRGDLSLSIAHVGGPVPSFTATMTHQGLVQVASAHTVPQCLRKLATMAE